jgi:hypothetical protein
MASLLEPTPDQLADYHLDITGAETVQIETDKTRGILWVNINGVCVLRVCRARFLTVEDR